MDQQAQDVGRRQSVFRQINERIGELAETFDMLQAIPIVCECGHPECKERLELTVAEYEGIRRIPTHFALVRGHDLPAFERVVEENDRYVVVEKFGESAIPAIEADPRKRRGS